MARRPKPWFREARGAWFVTVGGVQNNLGPDKKLAFERFYELMRQPQERKVDPRSLITIVNAFLHWVRTHRSPDTFEWYRYRLQRFVEKHPDLRVGDMKPFHAQKWVDSYPDLSVTSRRNYLRSIKRCLAWAVKQGYLDKNPISALEVPTGERREVVISPNEYETMLSFCRDENFRDLVIVTWETGCRPQESLRVEARHVDLANQRWIFPQKESKGKRAPRIVYLNDKALEIGTGSTYQATVLAEMGAKVFTIERQKILYEKTKDYFFKTKYPWLKFFYGDGFEGLPSYAPFDKILITAAAPFIPPKLIAQMKTGGLMVIPVDEGSSQRMLRLTKNEDGSYSEELFDQFSFVPMLSGKNG